MTVIQKYVVQHFSLYNFYFSFSQLSNLKKILKGMVDYYNEVTFFHRFLQCSNCLMHKHQHISSLYSVIMIFHWQKIKVVHLVVFGYDEITYSDLQPSITLCISKVEIHNFFVNKPINFYCFFLFIRFLLINCLFFFIFTGSHAGFGYLYTSGCCRNW